MPGPEKEGSGEEGLWLALPRQKESGLEGSVCFTEQGVRLLSCATTLPHGRQAVARREGAQPGIALSNGVGTLPGCAGWGRCTQASRGDPTRGRRRTEPAIAQPEGLKAAA
jgi:hypothetical protein